MRLISLVSSLIPQLLVLFVGRVHLVLILPLSLTPDHSCRFCSLGSPRGGVLPLLPQVIPKVSAIRPISPARLHVHGDSELQDTGHSAEGGIAAAEVDTAAVADILRTAVAVAVDADPLPETKTAVVVVDTHAAVVVDTVLAEGTAVDIAPVAVVAAAAAEEVGTGVVGLESRRGGCGGSRQWRCRSSCLASR